MPPVQIFVPGEPAGQPRIKAARRGGFVTCYTPKKVKNATTGKYHIHPCEIWKSAIADEWRRSAPAMPKILTPVCLTLSFYMPRPKSHFKSQSAAALAAGAPMILKPSAPKFYAKKPDADNMAKAVMDALTQLKAWEDDDQVVILKVVKQFADGGNTGCAIHLKEAEQF